jgi:hypothetical protein
MIKDVCFNDLDCFPGICVARSWGPPENRLRGRLWGRLEGAALYGSSKAY